MSEYYHFWLYNQQYYLNILTNIMTYAIIMKLTISDYPSVSIPSKVCHFCATSLAQICGSHSYYYPLFKIEY